MTTITEDYVSFEIAKLLKEKGFYGKCLSMYVTPKWNSGNGDPNKAKIAPHGRDSNYYDGYMYQCEAPTHQMALKWLREVHKLYIEFVLNQEVKDEESEIENYYCFNVSRLDRFANEGGDCKFYKSYEEAVEAGIKCCLTNLI